MAIPFRAIHFTDLPLDWQAQPSSASLRMTARQIGTTPEKVRKRIVFVVPETPLFLEYELFLHEYEKSTGIKDVINCMIQNADTWRSQAQPMAFRKLMDAMTKTGAPPWEQLGCAYFQVPSSVPADKKTQENED